MKPTLVHEHNVCLEILPEKAKILDIGCRGFGFTNHFRQAGHEVTAVDIDDLGVDQPYRRVAIWDRIGLVGIQNHKDPQATKVCAGMDIESTTLHEFSNKLDIKQWDLIKIDVEGAELQIINSLCWAPAKQLSIEFHLHTGIYADSTLYLLVKKLEKLGYEAVSHEKTSQHGCGLNYWSSLFVLKKHLWQ